MSRWVRRIGPDAFEIDLADHEKAFLLRLCADLRDLLLTDDQSLWRLYPTAYTEDDERQAEYVALVRDSLLESRLAGLDVVEATVGIDVVDETQLSTWMKAINEMRLVLGTRLDVQEDEDDPPDDHPLHAAYTQYHYLGWLLGDVIDALAGGADLEPS